MINVPPLVSHRQTISGFCRYWGAAFVRNLDAPFLTEVKSPISTAFVVGCGHSGTTLVAAKLGLIPGCFLPGWETGLFLPITGLNAGKQGIQALLKTAESVGATTFLEKTPKHVHCVSRIDRILPKSKYLVVVRNPLDTCASLYKRFSDLPLCVERWNIDNEAALQVLSNGRAVKIVFEEMVADPSATFLLAAQFLGLSWNEAYLDAKPTAYGRVSDGANMKLRAHQVAGSIGSRVNVWRESLSEDQARYVVTQTRSVALRLGYELSGESN